MVSFLGLFLQGSAPETSGGTLGTPYSPKVAFWMHLWCPGESLWAAFGVFGEPWVPQWTNCLILGTTQAEKS